MKAFGSLARGLVGLGAAAVIAFGLNACGPRVTDGDENSVLIESGPFTSLSETQRLAQEHCAKFGKSADVEGSNQNPATLQDTYRFDCEEDPI